MLVLDSDFSRRHSAFPSLFGRVPLQQTMRLQLPIADSVLELMGSSLCAAIGMGKSFLRA